MVIVTALLFRWFKAPYWLALSAALAFGIGGLGYHFLHFRNAKAKWCNASLWCPIGTIVNHYTLSFPFQDVYR